ncbi:unnamed protein product, partial [Brassica oleracea]
MLDQVCPLNASWKVQQKPNTFMWLRWRLRLEAGFLIMYKEVWSLWIGI